MSNISNKLNDNTTNKSISCENIPPQFLDKQLAKQYFGKFGKLKRFILYPQRYSCKVEYENNIDAENAVANAGTYNGINFDITFTQKEIRKEKTSIDNYVDPDVLAELNAMGGGNTYVRPNFEQQEASPIYRKNTEKTIKIYEQKKKPIAPPKQKLSSTVAPLPIQSPSGLAPPSASASSSFEEINPIKLTSIDPIIKNDLEQIMRRSAYTAEEKLRVLEARDKLIRLTTTKTTDIKIAVSTKGVCPDMCPEKERVMREVQHQIALFELDANSRYMNHSIAIKQYSRSSADQESSLPHELRPSFVLKMTMNYLLHNIMDLCDLEDTNIAEWYHFVWDRTRSIRKDITQQELCCSDAVSLVEQCARFHIHCAARLIAEEPQVFDQKINTENLTKCLQSLKYLYHDLRLKSIECQNEAEFRAYVVLLNLQDCNFLWEVKQLPIHLQHSAELRFAIQIYLAMENNNYMKFFALVRQTTYLNACILLRYFTQIRLRALHIILKAYAPRNATIMAISYLTYVLAFEDDEQCYQFLITYGMECDYENDRVALDRNSFCHPDMPLIVDRSINIVEHKRQCSVGEAVYGGPLEPLNAFLEHKVHNSFDENHYLLSDAWNASDQNYLQPKVKAPHASTQNEDNLFKIPFLSAAKIHHQSSIKPQFITPSLKSTDTTAKMTSIKTTTTTTRPQPPISIATLSNVAMNEENESPKVLKENITFSLPILKTNKAFENSSSSIFSSQPLSSSSENKTITQLLIDNKSNSFQGLKQRNSPLSPPPSQSQFDIFVKANQEFMSTDDKPNKTTNLFSGSFATATNNANRNNNYTNIFSNFSTTIDNKNQQQSTNIFNIPTISSATVTTSTSTNIFGNTLQPISTVSTILLPPAKVTPTTTKSITSTQNLLLSQQSNNEQQQLISEKSNYEFKIGNNEIIQKNKQTSSAKMVDNKINEINVLAVNNERLDKLSELYKNEILNEFIESTIKICINEETLKKKDIKYTKLTDELINEYLNEYLYKMIEIALDLYRTEFITRKYFNRWLKIKNVRKFNREIIDKTPIWLPIQKPINEFEHPLQQITINLKERYLSGYPNNLNELTLPPATPPKPKNLIDIFQIIKTCKTFPKQKLNENSTLLKSNIIYWKCVISIPDFVEEQQFSNFIDTWIETVFVRKQSALKKIFLLEEEEQENGKNLNKIRICIRKCVGGGSSNTSLLNEENEYILNLHEYLFGTNAIIFFMAITKTTNFQLTRSRIRTVLENCTNLNKSFAIIFHHLVDEDSNCMKDKNQFVKDILNLLNINDLIENVAEQCFFIKTKQINFKHNTNMLQQLTENCLQTIINNKFNCNAIEHQFELQQNKNFLQQSLIDEFWKRIELSIKFNPLLFKSIKNINFVINLYNIGIDHLIKICTNNAIETITKTSQKQKQRQSIEFPKEFKVFLPLQNHQIENFHNNLPLTYEYFPNNWSANICGCQSKWKQFLGTLKLTEFPIDKCNTMENLQKELFSYCYLHITNNSELAQKTAYQIIHLILTFFSEFNNNNNNINNGDDQLLFHQLITKQFSWIDSIQIISLAILINNFSLNENQLPNEIIYNKNEFYEFIKRPWWIRDGLLNNININLTITTTSTDGTTPDTTETAINDTTLKSFSSQSFKNVVSSTPINNNKNNNQQLSSDENPLKKLKLMKQQEQEDINEVLQRGQRCADRATKLIGTYKMDSKNLANIVKDLNQSIIRYQRNVPLTKRKLQELLN